MMKSKNIKILVVFVITLFLGTACSEERLNLLPLAEVSDETFFATEQGPYQALWGVYKVLQHQGYSGIAEMSLGSCASDDAEFGGELGGNDQREIQELCYLQATPITHLVYLHWRSLYQGIQRATTIIHKLPAADYSVSEEEMLQIVAEARVLRAFFYFEATKSFGGVALYDEPLLLDEVVGTERSSIDECYNFIESELLAALPYINDVATSLNGELPNGRVNTGLINALLARLYVFESSYAKNYPGDERFAGLEEKWEEVIEYSEKLINSPLYSLMGLEGETYPTAYGDATNPLQYLFTVAGENCPESIFEVQFIREERPPDFIHSGDGPEFDDQFVGQFTRYYPGNTNRNMAPSFNGDVDLARNAIRDVGPRFGYNCPTDDLMDEMDNYFPDDPRINYWIAQGEFGEDSILMMIDDSIQYAYYDFTQSPTGRAHKKCDYTYPSEEYMGPNWEQNAGNIRILRLAEVILWAAEAEFMLGNEPQARNYVNMIRQRARLAGSAENNNEPAEFTTAIEFEDIIRERRIELCFESQRYFDLVRWGIADEEISGLETLWGGTLDFEPGKHEFYPIPQFDIDLSQGSLIQNPGY